MTCIEDECERSGLYSNSASNTKYSPHPCPLPKGEGERVVSFSLREKVPKGRMRGFTLAEVLITLGIIGVVAALTIPTLISNNNKRIVETRLQKFYSIMQNAVKLSEVDNGSHLKWDKITLNGEATKSWFEKYLQPYLKTTSVSNDDIGVIAEFPDGSLVYISYYAVTFYPKSKDADYENIGACQMGKSCFIFNFYPGLQNGHSADDAKYILGKGFVPYKFRWDGTENALYNHSPYGCNNMGQYCTSLIEYNAWKIPEDYPFKF